MIQKKCLGIFSAILLIVCLPLSGVVGFSTNLDYDEELSSPLFDRVLSDALDTNSRECYSAYFLGKGQKNLIPFSHSHENAILKHVCALYDTLDDHECSRLRTVVSLFLRGEKVEAEFVLSKFISNINVVGSFDQTAHMYRDSLEQHVCITFFPFFRGCIFLLIFFILTYLKNNQQPT